MCVHMRSTERYAARYRTSVANQASNSARTLAETWSSSDTEEGAELARFIFFCYDTVWRHVRRVRQFTAWCSKNMTDCSDLEQFAARCEAPS